MLKKRPEGHGALSRGRIQFYGRYQSAAPLGANPTLPAAPVRASSAPTIPVEGAHTVPYGALPCLPGAHAAPTGALSAPFRSCTRSSSGTNAVGVPGNLLVGGAAATNEVNTRGISTTVARKVMYENKKCSYGTVLVNGVDVASPIYSCLIPLIIDYQIHSALLDTGSSVSLIERRLVTGTLLLHDTVFLRTAGQGPGLQSQNKVVQTFTINDKTYVHEFLVVDDLNLPGIHVLLGFDIIKRLKISIHGGEPTKVVLDNMTVPVIPCDNHVNVNVVKVEQMLPLKLYTNDDIVIPACTSMNISMVIKGKRVSEKQLVLISPDNKYCDYCPPEAVCHVHEQNEVFININNFMSVPLFIPQGTYFAEAEPVSLPCNYAVSSIVSTNNVDSDNEHTFEHYVKTNTPDTHARGVLDIVRLYRNTFVVNNESTGFTDYMPFTINTGNAYPISQRPYRLPVAYENEVNSQLEAMQRDNIISLSKSPWASPMVVVKKKDNSLRLCVDYRKLNAVTEGDSFPLPSIEELLLKVRNSKYFSTLDLKSGYHQVAVALEDRPKTAFIIGDKLFEYNTLPYGVKNAPSHFSRLMSSILSSIIGSAVLIYLDDIVILGNTVEEHASNLIRVLEILKKYNLKCNLRKCKFFQSHVEFLGHVISSDDIQPVHDKVESIRNFPVPKNAKEVNSFLGLCSYYRKFINKFAEISRPLDHLRKTEKFMWNSECQLAFDKLRDILSSDDMLTYPRFDRPFLVTCDASAVAIGGVVSQLDDDGTERPISFCSRALKGAEVRYSSLDREALAIKYVLERHRYFLLGHDIKIKSDHQPLKYLFLKGDLSNRQARWIDSLLEFQIVDFAYITGRSNRVADALSRGVVAAHTHTRRGGEKRYTRTSSPAAAREGEREEMVVSALTRAQTRANSSNVVNQCIFDEEIVSPPSRLLTHVNNQSSVDEQIVSPSSRLVSKSSNLADSSRRCVSSVRGKRSPNDQVTPSTSWQSGSEHSTMNNDSETDCTTSSANVCMSGAPMNVREIEWDVVHLIQSQDRDPIWSKVKKYVENNSLPFPDGVRIPKEQFVVENGVLYVLTRDKGTDHSHMRTVLTPEFARLALELVHCCTLTGHMGLAKTLKRAKANFYWPGMDRDVKQFIEKCDMCIRFKGHHVLVPPARQWPIAQEKFYRVHMDLVGPLPTSVCGNRFICVITDALTRYTFTDVLPDKRALTVARSFVKFINSFGCPHELITDQGKEFNNQLLEEVNKLYNISHNYVVAYRPSANGLVESKNKQIINILKMLVADSPLDWPNQLQAATTALNTAYNRAIGDNPHFLVYGQDIRYPFDTFVNRGKKPFYNIEAYRDYLMETNHHVFKLVKHMLKRSAEVNQKEYDIRFSTRESPIKEGDRVYVKRMQMNTKLDSRFIGPFRVLEASSDKVTLKNLYNHKVIKVHLSNVLLVRENDSVSTNQHGIKYSPFPDQPYE